MQRLNIPMSFASDEKNKPKDPISEPHENQESGKGAEWDLSKKSALNLLGRVIRHNWQIPDQLMSTLPGLLIMELQKTPNTRNKIAITKVLLAMQANNRQTAELAMNAVGIGQPEVVVNVGAADTVVNQRMTAEDITGVINELNELGVNFSQDAESNLSTAQTN